MAKFLILVDRPAIGDREKQLKDGNGRYVWHLLFGASAPMRDLAIEFLIDDNGYNRWRSIEAKHKPTVIIAMGQVASDQFDIEGKVQKTRGSVYRKKRGIHEYFVVPTFHPQELKKPYNMFMDVSLEKGFYTAGDILKAVRVYREGWPKGGENFLVNPTLDDVRNFVESALTNNWLLGCDLEATGLNIEHVDIVVHGFAWSEQDAIVIPETKLHGERYWTKEDWSEVVKLLNKVYTHGHLMYQNGVGYDIPLLRARGWEVNLEAYVDETMILHHTINPELPHNIGFISSIYGRQPYWKDSFLSRKEHIFETDQEEMKIYNARDCVALHQIKNAMDDHIQELVEKDKIWGNLPYIYQQGMKVARVVIEMQSNGILLDKTKVGDWHKYVTEKYEEANKTLCSLKDLPTAFKLTSGDHLRYLLYGEIPPSWGTKYSEELKYYEFPAFNYQFECTICERKVTKKFYDFEDIPSQRILKCPKCKTTRLCKRTEKERTNVKARDKNSKKYIELMKIKELLELKPLYRLYAYKPPKTKIGNASAVDKGALVRYLIGIDSRLSQLASMKRRHVKHDEEEIALRATRVYIIALQEWLKITTLRGSFWEFPTWLDGRVRPSFLVTGTATGRFSCKKPNLMQVPSGDIGTHIRSCFKASEDCWLVSSDWSNLEVQIGARVFGDTVLIKLLEAGINMHDDNTRVFFGIEKDNPRWSALRKVSKIIMFGRLLYGGSDNGIYSQVMTAVPDCGLTLPNFKIAVQNYFKVHPEFAEWCLEVQKLAVNDKLSINAFDRVRSLLGPVASIKRQALNSPIQGSAADFMRDTMILISEEFRKANLNGSTKMLLQIHDELVFDVPKKNFEQVVKIIEDVMTRPITINGYTFSIPIDVEAGKYWGDLKGVDLKTYQIMKGSKH